MNMKNNFISEVMKSLWSEQSELYQDVYRRFKSNPLNELVEELRKRIDQSAGLIRGYDSPTFSEVFLPSTGCSHCLKESVFCGCSFCDFVSNDVEYFAKMKVIRDQSEEAYAQLICYAFKTSRGENVSASLSEAITLFDSLDVDEFPDTAYYMLFGQNQLYKKRPFQVEIEARASSVTKDRLCVWKSHLPARRLIVRMGVEVGDELLRNQWLNKSITDNEIYQAIEHLKESKCKSNANILIGIPGLNERQSINMFIDSVLWADVAGFDQIVLSPLIYVGASLQSYIATHNGSEGALFDCHTGFVSICAIYEGLVSILLREPSVITKIGISVFNMPVHWKQEKQAIGNSEDEEFVREAYDGLMDFNVQRDVHRILSLYSNLQKTQLYSRYQSRVSTQSSNYIDTIYDLSKKLSMLLWHKDWEDKLNTLSLS